MLLVISYLIAVTNWGFNLSATRKVSVSRAEHSNLTDIFMVTWSAQWILCALVIVILGGLVVFSPFFSKDRLLYVYGTGLVIGNVMQSAWFFNGMERIRDLAVIQLATKLPSVLLILIFVNDPGDAYVVMGINAATSVMAGVLAVLWIGTVIGISWAKPRWRSMRAELKDGAGLFASTMCTNLYGALAPTLLGLLIGPLALGYYNLADRARGAATTLIHPLTHALFPRMSHLFAHSHAQASRLLWLTGKIVMVVSGLMSMCLFILAGPIIALLGGDQFGAAKQVLEWLSPLPLLTTLSSFFIHQIIIPAEETKRYYGIIIIAGCVGLIVVVPLIVVKEAIGAALAVLVTEGVLFALLLVVIRKHRGFLRAESQG